MDKSLKELIIKNSKFTMIVIFIVSAFLSLILDMEIAFPYFLGAVLGVTNFIFSGVVTGKYLLEKPKIINLGYILRILLIILMSIPFTKSLAMFLAYLGGFITHHICLIIYWIFIRERK